MKRRSFFGALGAALLLDPRKLWAKVVEKRLEPRLVFLNHYRPEPGQVLTCYVKVQGHTDWQFVRVTATEDYLTVYVDDEKTATVKRSDLPMKLEGTYDVRVSSLMVLAPPQMKRAQWTSSGTIGWEQYERAVGNLWRDNPLDYYNRVNR